MAKEGNMVYIGLCGRLDPPLIGVYYKNRQKDEKKKVYTILLQRLIFNPNAEQVVNQLYRQHAHILKQDKIPKEKIINIFTKIQAERRAAQEDYDDEQFEQEQQHVEKRQMKMKADHFEFEDEDQHPKLNKSR